MSSREKKYIFIRLLGVKKCCQLSKCNLSIHEQEVRIYCRGQKMRTWVPVSLLEFKPVLLVMSSSTDFTRVNFFLNFFFLMLFSLGW